jgi:SNF2 family DNA or RNA helicase
MNYHLEEIFPDGELPKGGKFFYKGERVIIDPFASSEFYYEISENQVKGKLRLGEREIDLSACEALFPGWFLYGSVLRKLPEEVDFEWIERVYPLPKPLSEATFLKILEKKRGGVPSIVRKENPPVEAPSILPYLELKDRTGAFGDLWMDYGEGRRIAFHDESAFPERRRDLEREWQRDLLETDFIEKRVGETHYYCPLDRVSKSLSFLLEIGWRLFDHLGRAIVRQSKKEISLELKGEKIVIDGEISYASHQTHVKNVLGAFNRRERFVHLNDSTVGLIDLPKEWVGLSIEEEEVVIKKAHFALLGSYFSEEEIQKRDEGVSSLLERIKSAHGVITTSPKESFRGELYTYQQEGLDWLYFLYTSGFHGLLADEMGLGKTVQVLSLFSLIEKGTPILIIAPTSLLFNWKREFERFLPASRVYLHTGPTRLKDEDSLKEKEVILTSYALLRLDASLLQALGYECIVIDEAQAIKNPQSQLAKAALGLRGRLRLAITGTPIENRSEDLWSLFSFLMPELLGDLSQFNLPQTKKKIGPFILRRKKAEVAKDLPPKCEQIVWVDMAEEQRAFYEEWLLKTKKGVLTKIAEGGITSHRMEILEAILRLRQICCHPQLVDPQPRESSKLQRVIADLEDVIASRCKVIIYSQFTTMLRLIEREVIAKSWRYVYLDGATKEREHPVKIFQEDESVPLFLMSLKAGGVGLNLTAADYVFLYDPWWNEAVEAQAIDRAHRVGKRSTVIARRYVTIETIEEKIMKLKEHKSSLVRGFLDGGAEGDPLSLQDLYELLV